jgi:hypothetical protein
MNANYRTASHGHTLRETFVAELTTAAYAVALRQGTGHSWLDLQLDLWKALDETVTRWGQECPADDDRCSGHGRNPVPRFGRER